MCTYQKQHFSWYNRENEKNYLMRWNANAPVCFSEYHALYAALAADDQYHYILRILRRQTPGNPQKMAHPGADTPVSCTHRRQRRRAGQYVHLSPQNQTCKIHDRRTGHPPGALLPVLHIREVLLRFTFQNEKQSTPRGERSLLFYDLYMDQISAFQNP